MTQTREKMTGDRRSSAAIRRNSVSVSVLSWLLLACEDDSCFVETSARFIAKQLGFPKDSVLRTLHRLEARGKISFEADKKGCVIRILSLGAEKTQKSPVCDTESDKTDTTSNETNITDTKEVKRNDGTDSAPHLRHDLRQAREENKERTKEIKVEKDIKTKARAYACETTATTLPTPSSTADTTLEERQAAINEEDFEMARRIRNAYTQYPTTSEEVLAAATMAGIVMDKETAQEFLDYYEARGWRLPYNVAIIKWRSMLRSWVNRNKEFKDRRKQNANFGGTVQEVRRAHIEGAFNADGKGYDGYKTDPKDAII